MSLLGKYRSEEPKQAGARGVGKSGVPLWNSTSPTNAELGLSKKESAEAQALHVMAPFSRPSPPKWLASGGGMA